MNGGDEMIDNYDEILAYAKKIKETNPSISPEDMKKVLSSKFIEGIDILPFAGVGCICRTVSLTKYLSIVYNSFRKLFIQDKDKLVDIQEKINRAVIEIIADFNIIG